MPNTHASYVNALKSALAGMMKQSLIKALILKAPFLSWGPASYLMSIFVGYIVDVVINQTELAIFLNYTDVRVDKQGRAFADVAISNFFIQKSGTPEQKKNAELLVIERFREFVRFAN